EELAQQRDWGEAAAYVLCEVFDRAFTATVRGESATAPTQLRVQFHQDGTGAVSLRAKVDGPGPGRPIVVDARAPPTRGAATGETSVLRVEVSVVGGADRDLVEQAAA